ncbi:serine/threonine protein kinase [Sorangium sp. So ce1000]|uniref:serine/threonine protein kinase n=1 Tax=Sorangium sp. So ce1000 TaxID=3133325 RepID=UPI003F645BE2
MPASRPRRKNAESDPPPELFAGKYRLIRMLGKGGMGEVWLAEEGPPGLGRHVALKRLVARPGLGDRARESFFAEAQVIARLDHPNVVRLIELGEFEGSVYLALDYIDGPALDRVLRKVGAFSPRAVAYIGREMARALEAVHGLCEDDGRSYAVVHRDVSPSNILIGRDGRVCLTDFGVARVPGLADEQTDSGVFKGKLPYMPPEQARGEPFDGRADVFSLGLTLLEALLGSRVRKAETQTQLIMGVASMPIPRTRELLPDLSARLSDALDAATEFSIEKRIASAGKLAGELEQVLCEMGHGAEQEARSELKEHVEAYIARAGSLSGAGCRASPSLPPESAPRQSSPGVARKASADRLSVRPSSPDVRRSVPAAGRSDAPLPLGAAMGSLSVQYLDFDGPDDVPQRPRVHAMTTTPEGELQRGLTAAGAAGDAAPAASKPSGASRPPAASRPSGASKPPAASKPFGASRPAASAAPVASTLSVVSTLPAASEPNAVPAVRPGEEAAPGEEPAVTGLSAEQRRRKKTIFYAGLFVLGALATIRLIFVSDC